MRRGRSTKQLARRIDMHYFKYPHPLRRWRFLLSVAVPVVALAWIAWAGVAGDLEIYSGGPVSVPHTVIGQQCETCHISQPGVFREHVNDQACLACHDGPAHTSLTKVAVRAGAEITPECGSCHVEHKGAVRLADVDDQSCTQCHATLQLRDGATSVVTAVSNFNTAHPEFAVLRNREKDDGTIRLNHSVHLRAGLRGLDRGASVQLECQDCHRPPGETAVWPYGEPQYRTAAARKPKNPLDPEPSRRYMEPVKYALSCAGCHSLQFSARFDDAAPHDKPEIVRAFVRKKFSEYLAKNPGAWREVVQPERRLPGRPPEVRTAARSPQEWLTGSIADAENFLWNKTCKECHSMIATPGKDLPEVAPAKMRIRWMPRSVFDHEAHRMMDCNACHNVKASQDTQEILMPAITDCQQCHNPRGARASCYECHTYHDPAGRKHVRGRFSIPQLLRHARSAGGK